MNKASQAMSLCLLSSCLVYRPDPPLTAPSSPPALSKKALAEDKKTQRKDDKVESWWKGFEDPALDQLVAYAMRHNLELATAEGRIRELRALMRLASADRLPQLSAVGSINRTQQVVPLGDDLGVQRFTNNSYSTSIPARFELDLWRRIGSEVKARRFELSAGREDRRALRVTIAAAVAEAWFDWAYNLEEERLLKRQLDRSAEQLRLLKRRLERGLATADVVYRQAEQEASRRADAIDAKLRSRLASQQLAVLLGMSPSGAVDLDDATLPRFAESKLSLTTAVLQQRPDLRAAEQRVAAADYRVAAAVAGRLPTFTLNGSMGFSTPDLDLFFDSFVWSVGASTSVPLFEGGRRVAIAQQTRAALEQRLNDYRRLLLEAEREVQGALVQEHLRGQRIKALEEAQARANDAVRSARTRFDRGLTDYLTVLLATERLDQTSRTLLFAQRQHLSDRVQLCRATGGIWPMASPAKADRTRQTRSTGTVSTTTSLN